MPACQLARNDAVGFLGEGVLHVPGAQTSFDVPDGDAMVEARQRHRHDGGGVSLNENDIGLFSFEYGIEFEQKTGSEFG